MIELENAGQAGLRHFVSVEWACTRMAMGGQILGLSRSLTINANLGGEDADESQRVR